ncbi:forkhead box protein I1-A [Anabrus simplex]|uniref:forkhead box protein I1-A n=1 Tax=Anabrus simplex TaxID=316456 RepID=UPI0035A2E249
MCSNERTAATSANGGGGGGLLHYPLAALKQLNDASSAGVPVPTSTTSLAASIAPGNLLPIDHYRLQLYNYAMAERLRFSHHYPAPLPLCPGYPPYGPRLAFSMSLFHHRAMQPEEPKPQHSYIGLIAMAILSSPETKLVLSDIYQYILDNYPYFRTRGPGWRNSIRHNLSLNDCFIKAGRSANGKGHYWAIHPANVEDFKKGDFRRRKAQRKVRKHMGLAVDEEGNDSPSPPPVPASPPPTIPSVPGMCWAPPTASTTSVFPPLPCNITRKRQFDVASLLAPDDEDDYTNAVDEDIDVVTSDQEGDKDSTSHQAADIVQAPAPWTQAPPPPLQQHPAMSVMFPGSSLVSSMEQQLVSRYYEQLAVAQQQQHRRMLQQQQQQQQQQQAPPTPQPPCSLSPSSTTQLTEVTES